MRPLVTGCTGMIGAALCRHLARIGYSVRGSSRKPKSSNISLEHFDWIQVENPTSPSCWTRALRGVDTVIHCAGLSGSLPRMNNNRNILSQFMLANVAATEVLAQQACKMGVKRLIFLSSVKVNGESTPLGQPFGPNSDPCPTSPYGISKWEAEKKLRQISNNTDLEVIVIRSPVVIGASSNGNIPKLVTWINAGLPLPFGRVHNKRSVIGLDNLIDLVIRSATYSPLKGNTLFGSDGIDISTEQLIKIIAIHLGKKPNLIPMPVSGLKLIGKLIGKADEVERLVNSLQIDIDQTMASLKWCPPNTLDVGIIKMLSDLKVIPCHAN